MVYLDVAVLNPSTQLHSAYQRISLLQLSHFIVFIWYCQKFLSLASSPCSQQFHWGQNTNHDIDSAWVISITFCMPLSVIPLSQGWKMLLSLTFIRLFVFIPEAQNHFPFFHVLVLSQLASWLVTHRWRCTGKCFCQAAVVWSWTAGKDAQPKRSLSSHTDSLWQPKYPSRYSKAAHCCSFLHLGQFPLSEMQHKYVTRTLLHKLKMNVRPKVVLRD